jgi:5-(carboxyamino)imidazole ribonucleotide mutase
MAANTTVPVLGVPVQSSPFGGLDSLLSIVQMPGGVPVASFSVGKAGMINAVIFAARMLMPIVPGISENYEKFLENGCKIPV